MDGQYIIRFVQAHETFRRPELEALATYESADLRVIEYREKSPFCIVQLRSFPADLSAPRCPSDTDRDALHPRTSSDILAASLISRSILSKSILELWGSGADYESLHADVKSRTQHLWPAYQTCSFKFSFDSYCGKRSSSEQRQIINSFSYMAFQGKIAMKNPEVEFVIMEEWSDEHTSASLRLGEEIDISNDASTRAPKRIYLGKLAGLSRRALIEKHDLKKRPYISTTSMDAELALVTATLALAAPNKFFLDPFVGTGGFMVAASELGAMSVGSDIDGRSFRGKGKGMHKGVGLNFKTYNLEPLYGDCIISDLTNTPFRVGPATSERNDRRRKYAGRWLDGIISDPPYGVREGLRVLGLRGRNMHRTTMVPPATTANTMTAITTLEDTQMSGPPSSTAATAMTTSPVSPASNEQLQPNTSTPAAQTLQPHLINGVLAHTLPDYIPPKKPYSLTAMLHDILNFAATTLVDGGRLAFWMPTANADTDADINSRPNLEQPSSSSEEEIPPQTPSGQDIPIDTTSTSMQTPIPMHPSLELKHTCTQSFNKWSRRLLVYERRLDAEVEHFRPTIADHAQIHDQNHHHQGQDMGVGMGKSADDLNPFRRMYFRGFQP